MAGADRCVCCGEIIPEGMIACHDCLSANKRKATKNKRLIDANALKWKLGETADKYDSDYLFFDVISDEIDNAPTVDAVEVVRCKDCKSWEQYNACDGTKPHRCMNHDAIFYKRTKPDDFCSYGERRTDNEMEA